jgi:hypothetical protein
MQITMIGNDLAKNVFQIYGADRHGKALLSKQLRRDQVMPFFANLQPCLIDIEACSSAHHCVRKLQALGHTVRLMVPQFVKPYVKSNKNDVADAEAICEAVGRPDDAVRAHQECRAAGCVVFASRATGLCYGQNRCQRLEVNEKRLKSGQTVDIDWACRALAHRGSVEGGSAGTVGLCYEDARFESGNSTRTIGKHFVQFAEMRNIANFDLFSFTSSR